MAKRRRALWRSPRLYAGCIALGLVLGATCPLWPESARPVCTSLSVQLKSIGFGFFRVSAPSTRPSAADAGS